MSFFKQNATFQESGSGEYEIAESGTYNCRLIAVDMAEQPDFNDPNTMKPVFIWKFETVDAFDSQDRPFRFTKYTGRAYGNEKAHLTNLINQMFGRALSAKEFGEIDLEELMERPWKVMVDEHKTQAGKLVNKIVSVRAPQKRVVMDAAPKVPDIPKIKAPKAEIDDPFGD
jgi:hypothetical protein